MKVFAILNFNLNRKLYIVSLEDHGLSLTEMRYLHHIMVSFDGHLKCALFRDKGVGEDLCV